MISFALDDELRLLQDTARRFASEVLRTGGAERGLAPCKEGRAWEHAGALPAEVEQAYWELGLPMLDLPDPDTGAAPRMVPAVLVQEELAWGDPAAAVCLSQVGWLGYALCELGDEAQRRRLLAPFHEGGRRRGAVAYSEGWKAPPQGFATQAVPSKGGYVLTGVKSYVLHAGRADLTLVFAQVNPDAGWDGFGVFAVAGAPDPARGFCGGARHKLLGLEALHVGELIFDEVLVAEEDRLRGDARRGAGRLFARGQLVTAARQVGLMRAAYEYALGYTQERQAFGRPVAHFQANSFRLADMLMDVESSRWLVWQAAASADHGYLDVSLCAQAAVHAGEAAWRVADACVQLLGGAGYIQDFPAEKWLRDTKTLGLFGGSAELCQQVVATGELGHGLEVAHQPVVPRRPGLFDSAQRGGAPLLDGLHGGRHETPALLPSCGMQPILT